jgi:exosortase
LSAGLVYLRWDEIKVLKIKGAWQGLAILVIGVTGQVLFAATSTTHMMNLSMLVVLFGVALWVLGWDYLRILWLPISYLVFAINPPGELYQRVTEPMQRIAATLASKILMIFNVPSEPRGTTLEVMWNNEPKMIEVADACSGMRMLIAFVALAAVLAYSSHRPNWQRIFLTLCAIPVAILCNSMRVAIIAALVAGDSRAESPWAHGAAHAYVGLAMIIPAALMQLAIAWMLDRIFVDDSDETPAGVKV